LVGRKGRKIREKDISKEEKRLHIRLPIQLEETLVLKQRLVLSLLVLIIITFLLGL